MKTRYLLIGFLVFSFSMLLAQKTEMKVNPKTSTQNVTKLNKQSVDSKSSINSAYSTQAVNAVTYDFTQNLIPGVPGSQFHGGTAAAKDMSVAQDGSGPWAMIAGETNNSGVITNADKDIIDANIDATGYLIGDTNMSGVVTNADKDFIDANIDRSSQVPN